MHKESLLSSEEKYIDAAILQGTAIKSGESKIANRSYTIMKRIFLKAQKDIPNAESFYKALRSHPEPNVRLWASAHSLALGLDISDAEKTLENLSQTQGIGLLRLNAEMTLKVWKQKGALKF